MVKNKGKIDFIIAIAVTAFILISVVSTALGLTLSNKTQNSKLGLPDIKNRVLDFTGVYRRQISQTSHVRPVRVFL